MFTPVTYGEKGNKIEHFVYLRENMLHIQKRYIIVVTGSGFK